MTWHTNLNATLAHIVSGVCFNAISNVVKIPRVRTNDTYAYFSNACNTLQRSLVPSSFTAFNTKNDDKSTRTKVANN
jgi:hypothetical protein